MVLVTFPADYDKKLSPTFNFPTATILSLWMEGFRYFEWNILKLWGKPHVIVVSGSLVVYILDSEKRYLFIIKSDTGIIPPE